MLQRRLLQFYSLSKKFQHHFSASQKRHFSSLTLKDIRESPANSNVLAHGWIKSIRRHKNVTFAAINDGSSIKETQLVISPSQAEGLEIGAAVRVDGMLAASRGSGQSHEILVKDIWVLGNCPGELYPIQKKELTSDFLRTIPHLRPRTLHYASLLRLKDQLSINLRHYLSLKQCYEVHAPVITFSDCEGGGEAFKIENGIHFFGREAFLTVSAQLHAEIAAAALGRVYTYGPVFRAEKHDTSRHLAEFVMLEVELSFIDSVHFLMDFTEGMIKEVVTKIPDDIWSPFACALGTRQRESLMSPKPYLRISYCEAIRELQKAVDGGLVKFTNPVRWGMALQSEHEHFLAENLSQGPIFVYDYPAPIKAFYMRSNSTSDDAQEQWERSTVACFDLLLPKIGEITGGSLREEREDILERSISRFGLEKSVYNWYLDLRRYGSAPHGGFGLGVDRLLQYLTLTKNIRDVVMIPRISGASYC